MDHTGIDEERERAAFEEWRGECNAFDAGLYWAWEAWKASAKVDRSMASLPLSRSLPLGQEGTDG